MRVFICFLMAVFLVGPVWALTPEERMADPVLESRAREIYKQLRCMVCQNESIDSSHADLAADLRQVVRDRLLTGDTNDAVIAYVQDRYGDFVLMRPPLNPATGLLWVGPFLMLILGGIVVRKFYMKGAAS